MRNLFLSLVTIIAILFCIPALAFQHIVVLGDSLSAGYGIDISQGWVALLQKKLKKENYPHAVINASISGDTTSNGLSRLPPLIQQYNPALFIIELGANDGLRGLALNEIEKNLSEMIELIQKNQSSVLLLGMRLPPNYGKLYTTQFHALYEQIARHYKIPLVPFFLAGVDNNFNLLQKDELHPLAKAQPYLLENVWVYLQPLLSDERAALSSQPSGVAARAGNQGKCCKG